MSVFPSEENVDVNFKQLLKLLSYERAPFPEYRLIRVAGHEALVISP